MKNVYVNTIGCQMNVYDSELMIKILKPLGYVQIDSIKKADLIIINTCSIREKAAEKTFSYLGRIAQAKKEKPNQIVVVTGCVAQNLGKEITRRAPYVDIVLGTRVLGRLPEYVKKVSEKRDRIIDIEMTEGFDEIKGYEEPKETKVSKFVTIMRGCDNYCNYCVVPYVRGREISREPESIINEIKSLIDGGTKEITLLGQNVNSYGLKENLCSFPELLHKIKNIDGLERIRFATSHPKDLSDNLIEAFKNIDKLCDNFHLPVQSGSNNVLKGMNRKYTREIYIERIIKLRSVRPDISITSDIIVGFPGESEEDFNDTLLLLKEIEFDSLFAFKYSDRSVAPASKFKNKIEEDVKTDRLARLNELQNEISKKKNIIYEERVEKVLVESLSKRQSTEISEDIKLKQWMGRTSSNKIVNFNHTEDDLIGRTIEVKIEKARANSLWGISTN
ncbi:MAG: tRNA (N6-isopentenyl adenosine(37)-C2)-methylthiotransferase MiaB [Deltaproteobacteria bacterium]|nr:tRNA (N6-isopentenyl adenosine(37)-C2)-methylthiotransferase MiaB [Deltaproteobacteria bacterium]